MAERRKNVAKNCKIGTGSALGKLGGVKLAVLHVVGGVVQIGLDLGRAYLLDDPCGHAHGYRAVRDDHALRHQRTRADDAVFAYLDVVHDDRPHAHEHPVRDAAAVDDGAVADGDLPAYLDGVDRRRVQETVVLDIGPLPDGDARAVRPYRGVEELSLIHISEPTRH